jgi:hypothetical protein
MTQSQVRVRYLMLSLLTEQHRPFHSTPTVPFVSSSSPFVEDRQLTVPAVLFTALAVTLTALRKDVQFFFEQERTLSLGFASPRQ